MSLDRLAGRLPRLLGSLASLLFAIMLTLPIRASITSSALTGRVMAGDVPAHGASVAIVSRTTQTVRTATTNRRGTYWLGALIPGQYDVTFSRPGLTSLTRPVTIELGRIARADARLEPSDDEESITSTATTVSVANTTTVTTHFTAEELERIPLRRDTAAAAELSPVIPNGATIVDDTAMFFPTLMGEEVLGETTVVRGAQPIELDRFGSTVILARTRSGSDELLLSLRDTYSTAEGGGNVVEGAGAGPIVRERLWFFGAAWGGRATDIRLRKLRGMAVKLTAQASPAHHLVAMHMDADARFSIFTAGTTATSLRYTGVFDQQLTAEAVMSRAHGDSRDIELRDDVLAAKVSYRLADHVISAGGSRGDQGLSRDVNAFFLSDRWASGRWTVDAGMRWDDERTTTRLALVFDLRSDQGSHAIVASWGQYLEGPLPAGTGPARTPVLRVASIGYTSSLESSGTARIDLFRYEGARVMDQVQMEVRYRLFDRFEAGGSYVYTRSEGQQAVDQQVPEHLLSARVGMQLPVGGYEFSAMCLERYDSTTWTTDFGIRYEIPFRRIALTLAADALNLVEEAELRLWVRVRR